MTTTPSSAAVLRFWHSPWLRPLNDRNALNDLLGLVHPLWAWGEVRARVVASDPETAAARSIWLQPNRNWRPSRPGQHVQLRLDIRGVRHERSYTIAQEAGGRICITVKRQARGKVSNWLHDHLQPGSIVSLSQPQGDFVLPDPCPPQTLMISAGSGITPVMRQLRALLAHHPAADVVFVHSCRHVDDAIYREALLALAQQHPGLKLQYHYSAAAGRLSAVQIAALVPDYARRATFLCGPQAFMTGIRAFWRAQGLEAALRYENFAPPMVMNDDGQVGADVHCARTGRRFAASGAHALLLDAEAAGLNPAYGCRRGICHTCSCVKRSGVVENLLTGRISAEPNERVQLCISRARSDLVLEL